MEGIYPIVSGTEPVGEVQVYPKGLYYHFRCRCIHDQECVCRLMIRCGNQVEKLGIMVPEGEYFVLNRQIAKKHFVDESPVFFLLGDLKEAENGLFIPISSEEPFEHLSRLQDAVLENREGILGAWIPEEKINAGE